MNAYRRLPRPCDHGRNGVWRSDCEYCVESMHSANAKDYERDARPSRVMPSRLTFEP